MGADSLMVSPTRGDDDDDDIDIPMCESPISNTNSPTKTLGTADTKKPQGSTDTKPEGDAPAPIPPPPPPPPPAPPTSSSPPPTANAPPPRVTTVTPASFVPIDADWSLPVNNIELLSKSEHAHVMLGTLDYYRTGVRQGILHLASLDRQRILLAQAQAEAEEEAEGTRPQEGEDPTTDADFIPPPEVNDMIAAMCALAVPGADYSITTAALKAVPIQFPVPPFGERPGGRREHIRELNEVAEQAIMHLAGFDAHMGQQRARWTAVLEQEKAGSQVGSEVGDNMKRGISTPPPPPPPPPPPLTGEDVAMTGV